MTEENAFQWGGEWTGRIDDEMNVKKTRVDKAGEWLQERLESDELLQTTLFEEGKGKGFSDDLLYRAKDRAGVYARKDGYGGPWKWDLKNGDYNDIPCE